MLSRIIAGPVVGAAFLFASAPLGAADIRGVVSIKRLLTHRTVTAPAGLYQRGPAVELGIGAEDDPLSYERSHVVVYLEAAPSLMGALHAEKALEVSIEQRDRRFVPDLVVVPAGSVVSFPNFDPVFHNVFSLSKAKSFDLGNYVKGETRRVSFLSPGMIAVYCHLHPNMAASIVVTPNSFVARVERDGGFVLKDVPPGSYSLAAWHKTAGIFRQTIVQTGAGLSDVNFVVPYVEPPGASHVAHR